MEPDFAQMSLIPAIVQDARNGSVLMLGYMNEEAYRTTVATGFVTFYSRSRARLWTKGETSGAKLRLVEMALDCDRDALLVRSEPLGPTCHKGSTSCFGEAEPSEPSRGGLGGLEDRLKARLRDQADDSYSFRTVRAGPSRLGQKIGEEGVELALAVASGNRTATVEEAADLVFHVTLALIDRGLSWRDVEQCLVGRRSASESRELR